MVLTRIHGTWYDTSKDPKWKHPGGPFLLEAGHMRDATAIFELHHSISSTGYIKKTLDKFRVSDEEATARGLRVVDERANLDAGSKDYKKSFTTEDPYERSAVGNIAQETSPTPGDDNTAYDLFDWGSGVHMPTSKIRNAMVGCVKDFLKEEQTIRGGTLLDCAKATPQHFFILAMLTLAIVFLTSLLCYTGNLVVGFPLAALLWVVTASLMHDGSHFALCRNPYVNFAACAAAPWLAGPSTWVVQHVIGHHAYTNVSGRDPDLYHAPENWRYHSCVDHRPVHKIQTSRWRIIWCVATLSTALHNELQSLKYNGVVSWTFARPRVGRFLYWACLVMRLYFLYKAFWAFPNTYINPDHWFFGVWTPRLAGPMIYMMCSAHFMAFSQVSHLDHESCESEQRVRPDFYLHQAETAQDYAIDSLFWCYYSVGLNTQVIHHLFPCVHWSNYPKLWPRLLKVCKEQGVNYRVLATYSDAFATYKESLTLLANPNHGSKKSGEIEEVPDFIPWWEAVTRAVKLV